MRSLEDDNRFAAIWMQAHEDGLRTEDLREKLGLSAIRSVFLRRRSVETRLGIRLPGLGGAEKLSYIPQQAEEIAISGTVLVCSDVHLWPDHKPFAWFCLLEAVKRYKPIEIWINGDLLDFPSISRHPRHGWEDRPTMVEEMDWARQEMNALTKAADKVGAVKRITRGNHDARFEAYIAKNAPGIEGAPGTTLKELYEVFDGWRIYHSLFVNETTMVKHTWHRSIDAARRNTIGAGTNIVTGHTHRLLARPFSDYKGVRFGVETGFLGEIQGPQFAYGDGNPQDWQPGFMVLFLDQHELLYEPIHTHAKRARVCGKWLYREDYDCSLQ